MDCCTLTEEISGKYGGSSDSFKSLLTQLAATHEHEVLGLYSEVTMLRAKVARLEKLEREWSPEARSISRGRSAPSKHGNILPSTPISQDGPVLSEWQSPGNAGKTFSLPISPVKDSQKVQEVVTLGLDDSRRKDSSLNEVTIMPEEIAPIADFTDDPGCDSMYGALLGERSSGKDVRISRISSYADEQPFNANSSFEAAWEAHNSNICFEHDNWRRFVVLLLESVSRELYQLKDTWCQSDAFMQKAKRQGRGQHNVDLFKPGRSRTSKSLFAGKMQSMVADSRMVRLLSDGGRGSRQNSWRALNVCNSEKSSMSQENSYDSDETDNRSSWLTRRCLPSGSIALNPSSPGRIMWSLAGLLLMIYDLIMLPMQLFELPDEPTLKVISWSAQIYWTIDIFVSFITGIYVKSELEMRIPKIARCYLMTWFPIDVIITLPLWFVLLMDFDDSSAEAGRGLKSARYVRMLRFLRLARLMKAEHLLGEALELLNSTSVLLTLGIVKLMVCMVLCNHVVACLWYAVGRSTQKNGQRGWALEPGVYNRSIEYKYFTAMHWTLTQFQGTSEIVVGGTLLERICAVWTVLFALIMLAVFVSGLTNMMMQLQSLQSKRTHEQRVVRGYLNNHKVSKNLSVRIKKHIAWKQRQQKRSEHDKEVSKLLPQQLMMDLLDEVSKLLPQQLMMDLLDEVRGPLICQHHFFFFKFREAYPFVIRRLCHGALEPVSPTPGELIFSPSDRSTRMYFLVSGSLHYTAIHHAHRKTFRRADQRNGEQQLGEMGSFNITNGEYLSEPVLWTNWEHAGELQVVRDAKTDAQMLYLIADSFAECVQSAHGAPLASATLYARRFLATLNTFGKTFTDLIPQEDILSSLLQDEDSGGRDSGRPSHLTPMARLSLANWGQQRYSR